MVEAGFVVDVGVGVFFFLRPHGGVTDGQRIQNSSPMTANPLIFRKTRRVIISC
jgi:hypothetical protein